MIENGTVVTEATPQAQAIIQIESIGIERLVVPIVGMTPLITNRFSEKAKRQMLDAAQHKQTVKEPKDPRAEYEAAMYKVVGGGYGMPAGAFHDATIGGARFYRSVTMTQLKQYILPFPGEPCETDGIALVRIEGEPQMREDVVRVGRGTDLRYRPAFPTWTATLIVPYAKTAITQDSVLSLIDAGGMTIGVGEWRPEKNGSFGTYRIDTEKGIEVIK